MQAQEPLTFERLPIPRAPSRRFFGQLRSFSDARLRGRESDLSRGIDVAPKADAGKATSPDRQWSSANTRQISKRIVLRATASSARACRCAPSPSCCQGRGVPGSPTTPELHTHLINPKDPLMYDTLRTPPYLTAACPGTN